MTTLEKMAHDAKEASHYIAKATTEQKNTCLRMMIGLLQERKMDILKANQYDIDEALAAGLSPTLIDRLSLQNHLDQLVDSLKTIISLPDPVGEVFESYHKNELNIEKWRTPIGLLGVIYESRPNVTVDITALALKSGNAVILRGGSEALITNKILADCMKESLIVSNLPENAIQFISTTDRSQAMQLLKLHQYIDLIIPRGGAALHQFCRENSTIPVITGGIGICHLFVDQSVQIEKSLAVILNAKTQRPTVCNSLDTLLVHEAIAEIFIPKVIQLLNQHQVAFHVDSSTLDIIKKYPLSARCELAKGDDWHHEWLNLILSIKIVKDINEAIEHIQTYSTGHSDGILTENKEHATQFVKEIDSAAVYINSSTRFTDGGELGLGGEVAISTQKLHARGPLGLKELTSYKWVISSDYAVRR